MVESWSDLVKDFPGQEIILFKNSHEPATLEDDNLLEESFVVDSPVMVSVEVAPVVVASVVASLVASVVTSLVASVVASLVASAVALLVASDVAFLVDSVVSFLIASVVAFVVADSALSSVVFTSVILVSLEVLLMEDVFEVFMGVVRFNVVVAIVVSLAM